jgi:hypothetical protein
MSTVTISWKRGLLAVIAVAASLFLIYQMTPKSSPESARVPLTDLQNVTLLREQFNRDEGMPRLILLVSPT